MRKLTESQIRQEIRLQLIRESIFKKLKSKIGKAFGKKNPNISKDKILIDLKQNKGNLTQSSRILMFLRYAEKLLAYLTDEEKLLNQRESNSTEFTAVKSVRKKINDIIDLLDHLKLEVDKFRSIKNQSFTNESYNFLNNPELSVSMILKMDAILASNFAENLRKDFDQGQTITQDIQNLCNKIYKQATNQKIQAKKTKEQKEITEIVDVIIVEWCDILKKGYVKLSNTVASISASIDSNNEKNQRSQRDKQNLDIYNTDQEDLPFKQSKPKTRKWEDLYNPKVQIGPDRSNN